MVYDKSLCLLLLLLAYSAWWDRIKKDRSLPLLHKSPVTCRQEIGRIEYHVPFIGKLYKNEINTENRTVDIHYWWSNLCGRTVNIFSAQAVAALLCVWSIQKRGQKNVIPIKCLSNEDIKLFIRVTRCPRFPGTVSVFTDLSPASHLFSN